MTVEITLLSETEIQPLLIAELVEAFPGRRLLESCDRCPFPLSDTAKYLVAIFNINCKTDPLISLKHYPHVVGQFLHYSFLIKCSLETLMHIKAYTTLSVSYGEAPEASGSLPAGVVAGTLRDWHTFLTYSCIKEQTKDFRLVCNKIIMFFEQKGLELIFSNWTKENANDGTFYMRGKNDRCTACSYSSATCPK